MGKTFGIIALLAGLAGVILLALLYIGFFLAPILIFPYIGLIIIIAGALGIIFGIIGIAKDDSKGLGIVGLILGIIAIALYFILPFILVGVAITLF
ncbi:MAG: hypothetical protein ACFFBH_10135 [Promethearchaeota archaeon]